MGGVVGVVRLILATIRTDDEEMQFCYNKKRIVLLLVVLLCLIVQIFFCVFAYYRTDNTMLPQNLPNIYSSDGEISKLKSSKLGAGEAGKADFSTQSSKHSPETTSSPKLEQKERVTPNILDRTTSVRGLLKGAPSSLINHGLNNTINSSATGWTSGSFCHDFLVRTFQKPIPVCAQVRNGAVQCFGNPFSDHMGTCIIENVVVSPPALGKAMSDADHTKFKSSGPSIAFLSDRGTQCDNMSVVPLRKRLENGDYVWQIVDKLKQEKRKLSSVCSRWIEEDVFFFTAHRFHIYFRFLDYFNLHKLLEDFSYTLTNGGIPRVIRISGSDDYHFSDFDQLLFPEVRYEILDRMGNESICFKKVILVPKSYASVLYQCKMPSAVRTKCNGCDGSGLSKTQMLSFRGRVLSACLLDDRPRKYGNSSIVFVSRKQYLRNNNDKANHFERVMDNENDLIKKLKSHFNTSVIQKVHFEDLEICQQVDIVHNADIYLGVHGSGLVHLWWLRDRALVYELEPHYEIGNPTFRTLARLSGRRYKHSSIQGGWGKVHADVNQVVADLDRYIKGLNSSESENKISHSIQEILKVPRLGII